MEYPREPGGNDVKGLRVRIGGHHLEALDPTIPRGGVEANLTAQQISEAARARLDDPPEARSDQVPVHQEDASPHPCERLGKHGGDGRLAIVGARGRHHQRRRGARSAKAGRQVRTKSPQRSAGARVGQTSFRVSAKRAGDRDLAHDSVTLDLRTLSEPA
jgi:hypothetical protein